MENTNSDKQDNQSTTSPKLCVGNCGFFGNEAFNNMCSQCYKAKHKDASSTVVKSNNKPTNIIKSPLIVKDEIIEKSRKHSRSPSPDNLRINSTTTSSITSPTPVVESSSTTPSTPTKDKPVQINKGRCFNCRLKVPLAKQAANKCRCGYVFCDSHRYPDRHDCDIDFVKMDREILAKNNPKLHERPKGGRSFQRIDSL